MQLVHRSGRSTFDSRIPFPPGGVYEDPATGAARRVRLADLGAVELPAQVTVWRGEDMGRPSTIIVDIPADPAAGIGVSGTAVRIP